MIDPVKLAWECWEQVRRDNVLGVAHSEQMIHLYTRKVIEQCAQVCDAQSKAPECPERAQYCAEAVRALLPEER